MKKILNQKGFTMIEMMIVLLVISVVLLLAIPNIANRSESINTKGCDALFSMIEGQVESYKLDEISAPTTINDLVDKGYLNAQQNVCSNGDVINIAADGTLEITTP